MWARQSSVGKMLPTDGLCLQRGVISVRPLHGTRSRSGLALCDAVTAQHSFIPPVLMKTLFSSIACILFTVAIAGCATSSPIQRFSESKSAFDEEPTLISNNIPQKDIYRVYQRAATGFVSIQSIRQGVEQRAEDFASRQGKSIIVLGEKISEPSYILGNFPRIEIVFGLIDKPAESSASAADDDSYSKLIKLKKLLDDGIITKDEFDREKAKILK